MIPTQEILENRVALLYGGTYTMFNSILPQFGITTKSVKPQDPRQFIRAITGMAKALYIETIGHPVFDFTDIGEVAKIAHENGIPLIVDSTFIPLRLLRPIDHGADIIIHSLTKWMEGLRTALERMVRTRSAQPALRGKASRVSVMPKIGVW